MSSSRQKKKIKNIQDKVAEVKQIMGEHIDKAINDEPSTNRDKLLTPIVKPSKSSANDLSDEKSQSPSSTSRVQSKLDKMSKMADSLGLSAKQFEKACKAPHNEQKPTDKKIEDAKKLKKNLLIAGSVATGLLTVVGVLFALKKSLSGGSPEVGLPASLSIPSL